MMLKLTTSLILILFVVVIAFGLQLTFTAHAHHGTFCPLATGEHVLCVHSPLAHVTYWQSIFLAVTLSVFAFAILLLHFFRYGNLEVLRIYFFKQNWPSSACFRPSLFQELFSAGILNRKAP